MIILEGMVMKNFLLIMILSVLAINAQEKLIVGTKAAEPFTIKKKEGNWTGVSFELWNIIAKQMDISYEIKEYDLEEILNAVEQGEIDIAVSPLTITSGREEKFDFTHPYFITGLSIAASAKADAGFLSLFKRVISVEFFEAVGVLILILFMIGFITWLFERKKNPDEFGDGKSKGLWSSFWFAAVTMTTVGYGDKSPKSVGGRIVALVWMFAAIIIISSITAAIASALTVGQLETKVKGLNDLYSANVGTVASSSAESFLIDKRINYSSYKSVEEGIEAIAGGELDAFVYDAPIMKYIVKKNNLSGKVKVLAVTLESVFYGFALPAESSLREMLNREIIAKISDVKWREVMFKYFGD